MSSSDQPTPTAERPKVVVHLDSAQRAELGRAARAKVPRSAHAEWAPGPNRADPVALLRAQEATPRPRARAPSPRADARVAVHVLPRGGSDHGCRPGDGAELGAAGAGVWGRPPRQLRRLRGTGSHAGLRHERLRRDRTRPVRMGRQAPGRELRDRGPVARVPGQDGARGRPTGGALVPGGDGPVRDDDKPRGLVLPARHAGRPRPLAEHCQPRRRQALRAHRRQGPEQEQPQGAVAAHAADRWHVPDRQRPADAGSGDRSRRRP